MPRERFSDHGQDLGDAKRAHPAHLPRPPEPCCPPCRQVGAAPPRPACPAPSLAAGERGAVPGPFTSSGSMESAAAAALPARSGAEGPALPALPHPPLAQPAPHKCINSSHIMINSSVPVTRGGGSAGLGGGRALGTVPSPGVRPRHGLRQHGGSERGVGAVPAPGAPRVPVPARPEGGRAGGGSSDRCPGSSPAPGRRDRAGSRAGKSEVTLESREGSAPRSGCRQRSAAPGSILSSQGDAAPPCLPAASGPPAALAVEQGPGVASRAAQASRASVWP